MLFELPDGDEGEWDLSDDGPDKLLLACDKSFASSHGGVIDMVTARAIRHELLVQLDDALTDVVKARLTGREFATDFAGEHSDLFHLCEAVVKTADLDPADADSVLRDAEKEKRAFLKYIASVVSKSPTYLGRTNGEDDCGPGGSSAYAVHWDDEPETAAKLFNDRVESDVKLVSCYERFMK